MSLRFGSTGFETPSPSQSAAGSGHHNCQADQIDGFGFEIDNFAGTPGSPRSPPPNARDAKASATKSGRMPVMTPAPPWHWHAPYRGAGSLPLFRFQQ